MYYAHALKKFMPQSARTETNRCPRPDRIKYHLKSSINDFCTPAHDPSLKLYALSKRQCIFDFYAKISNRTVNLRMPQ